MTPGTTPFFSSSDIQVHPPSGGLGATAVKWSMESASAGCTSQPMAPVWAPRLAAAKAVTARGRPRARR